jgi:mono/diheme cytochrome c family protein
MKDVSMLAHEVFVKRMDGQALTDDQEAALQSWLFAVPGPITSPPTDLASVARGRTLFESPEAKCTSCHSGARFTNNLTLNVGLGGMFQVPSLIGVSWRAPYLHDGRAPQLVDRFNPKIGGGDEHGQTSQLTASQIDDLVSYLETL